MARQNNYSFNRFNQMNDMFVGQFYDPAQQLQQQQQQRQQTYMTTAQQSYPVMGQQHLQQYYGQSQPQTNNFNMGQGSAPSWYQQQQQQPIPLYNYWYGMPSIQIQGRTIGEEPSGAQFSPDMGVTMPQIYYQPLNGPIEQATISRRQAEQGSQTGKGQTARQTATSTRTTAGGREVYGSNETTFKPFELECCTSLNRIDSFTSYKDHTGSRIRDSQQDMEEYLRTAARTLFKANKEAKARIVKQQKNKINKSSKKKSKKLKDLDDDDESIGSTMSSGAIQRFIRKLGLLMKLRTNRSSLFSLLQKQPKVESKSKCPKYPSPSSSCKKKRFFSRLFGESRRDDVSVRQVSLGNIHYPTDEALESMEEREVREAANFKKMRDKKMGKKYKRNA